MLVQPQREAVLDHTVDKTGALPRPEPLLGLPGELRVFHLHREDVGHALPHIFGRQFDAAREQAAKLAELAQRLGEPGAQAVDVGSAQGRGHEIDVAVRHRRLRVIRNPGQGPVHRFTLAMQAARQGLHRQDGTVDLLEQVFRQPTAVLPGLDLVRTLDLQPYLEPRAQHRLGSQHVFQAPQCKRRRVEILRVRPEAQRGPRIRLADRAHHVEFSAALAARETHVVLPAAAADPHFKVPGQRVHHGDAHAVQPTRKPVGPVGELAARVQLGKDQFDPGNPFLGVNVDRHAAAVIGDFQRTVPEKLDVDALGVALDGLVDAVVDDFVSEVVGPTGVGIHAGAPAHGVKTAQDLDVCSAIAVSH